MEMATEQHNDQEVQNLKNNNGAGLRLEEEFIVERYWSDNFVRQFSSQIKTCHSQIHVLCCISTPPHIQEKEQESN